MPLGALFEAHALKKADACLDHFLARGETPYSHLAVYYLFHFDTKLNDAANAARRVGTPIPRQAYSDGLSGLSGCGMGVPTRLLIGNVFANPLAKRTLGPKFLPVIWPRPRGYGDSE